MLQPVKIEVHPHIDSNYTGNIAKIFWKDNQITLHTAVNLRVQCPCASCKNQKISGISSKLRIIQFEWVGRYAVHFFFSDGHNTGIYTYKYLFEIQEKV